MEKEGIRRGRRLLQAKLYQREHQRCQSVGLCKGSFSGHWLQQVVLQKGKNDQLRNALAESGRVLAGAATPKEVTIGDGL